MTADGKITLSLPGPPVSASVSWEDVRAYLRADGWAPTAEPDADGDQHWRGPNCTCFTASNDHAGEMAHSIERLARLASVSPGEMLARIAGGPVSHLLRVADEAARKATAGLVQSPAPPASVGVVLTITHADEVRRAAEDMRERCAKAVEHGTGGNSRKVIATAIRALPIEPGKAEP